jgi:hypothetical protein
VKRQGDGAPAFAVRTLESGDPHRIKGQNLACLRVNETWATIWGRRIRPIRATITPGSKSATDQQKKETGTDQAGDDRAMPKGKARKDAIPTIATSIVEIDSRLRLTSRLVAWTFMIPPPDKLRFPRILMMRPSV